VEEAGGVATTVDSGLRALQRLDQEVPDVMVADLGMPGMDGLALIEAVRRRQDDARAVPAIALTAYTRSEDRITALSRGFQRHLAKPIDHIQLVSAGSPSSRSSVRRRLRADRRAERQRRVARPSQSRATSAVGPWQDYGTS
jgi:CheY-like chemotaxis protein